ncbi:Sodium-dependent phosphate transporter [Lachnospiraceae bacterium TWA4]|nr:Sodium-dependent phosphate transporter [Lachnospiraceae bacterium TWA4]
MFLYGMTIMSTGLRNACGDNLQKILEKATNSKIRAVLVGLTVTLLVQSSSATDVMVIGFVNSGFMNLFQAIGVIMGANIGTTVTAQITAFNISKYALLILFVGSISFLFIKKELVKYIGLIIMGFGMLFEGIALMKSAIIPLSETQQFIDFISSVSNPILLVLFGVAFTALLQSSSSATVIFQAFAMQGIIGYHTSVYLIIGSAIGSVTPNLLASLTTNRNGKRTAILNLLFNLFRAAILLVLITIFPQILDFIENLSPGNIGRQIANTHTIFAIFAVVVLLPFSDAIVRLSQKLIPQRADEVRDMEEMKLHYMTGMKNVPSSILVTQAKQEISRMGELALDNLRMSLDYFFDHDEEKAKKVKNNEDVVDYLNDAIVAGLTELHRATDISPKDMNRLYHLTIAVVDFERISDHAMNIVEHEEDVKVHQAVFSSKAVSDLQNLAKRCLDSVEMCLQIFENEDYDKLDEAKHLEDIVDDTYQDILDAHVERLRNATCNPLANVIFSDLAAELERCSDHAINIAFALVQQTDGME